MVNLSALNNLATMDFNTTIINETNQTLPRIISNANTTSDGYLGLLIMIITFIFITYTLFRDDGFFRIDIVRSMTFGSSIALLLGIIMIVSELITNYQHVVWFAVIFACSVVASYYLKKKNI